MGWINMKIYLWVLYYGRQETSVRARHNPAEVPTVKFLNIDLWKSTARHSDCAAQAPCISSCSGQLGQILVGGHCLFKSQGAWEQAAHQFLAVSTWHSRSSADGATELISNPSVALKGKLLATTAGERLHLNIHSAKCPSPSPQTQQEIVAVGMKLKDQEKLHPWLGQGQRGGSKSERMQTYSLPSTPWLLEGLGVPLSHGHPRRETVHRKEWSRAMKQLKKKSTNSCLCHQLPTRDASSISLVPSISSE